MSGSSIAALSFFNIAQLQYSLSSHTPVLANHDFIEPGAAFDPCLITSMYPHDHESDPEYTSRRMSASASTDSSGHPDTRTYSPLDSPSPARPPSDTATAEAAQKVSLPPLFSTFEDPWKAQPASSSRRPSTSSTDDPRPKTLPSQWQHNGIASFQFPALATPTTPSDDSNNQKDSHHGSSPGPYSAANSPYSATPSTASFAPTPSSASSFPGSALSPAFQTPPFPSSRFQSSKYPYSDKIDEPQPPFPRYPAAGTANMWADERRLALPEPAREEWSSSTTSSTFIIPDAPASSFPSTSNIIPSSVAAASGSGSGPPTTASSESTPPDKPQPRRRGKLPKQTTELLKKWLHSHTEHPYPTEDEKKQLCALTGLSISQVSNWMINARRRILVPANKAAAGPATTTSPYQAQHNRPAPIMTRSHHTHPPPPPQPQHQHHQSHDSGGLTLHHPLSYATGGQSVPGSRSSLSYSTPSYSSSSARPQPPGGGHYSYGPYSQQYGSSASSSTPGSYNVLQPPPGGSTLFPSHPSILPPTSSHSHHHHSSYSPPHHQQPPPPSIYSRHPQPQHLPPFVEHHPSLPAPTHHSHHATSSARYFDAGSTGGYHS